MRLFDTIKRSGRSLRAAKIRTVLTSLAIAVGGFTLTATLAAGNGVRAYTDRLVSSNFDPSELIVGRDKEISNSGAPSSEPKEYDESITSLTIGGDGSTLQLKQVTEEDIANLQNFEFITQIRANYSINARYITRKNQKNYTLSLQAYNPAQKPEIKTGKLPNDGDIAKGSVTLPDKYLAVLGFASPEAALGQEVSINIQKPFASTDRTKVIELIKTDQNLTKLRPESKILTFKIAAVTKKAATSINFGSLPVLISSEDALEMYDYTTADTPNHGKYTYVFAHIKEGQDPLKIKAAQDQLNKAGYYTQSSQDIQKSITQIVNVLQILVGVFGMITVVASTFGIINTQYISVLERTREIGLMKAMGMRRRDIRRLFMIEAGWIGLFGGVIGAFIAILVGTLANPWITNKLDLGEGNRLLIFNPWQIGVLIIALVVVAIVAGFLPARKASKLDPIVALRTE